MLRNMLDTNLCVRVLRDRPAGLRPRFNAESERLCISTITLTELLHGAARSLKPVENRQEVERMTSRLTTLDFDSRAAEHAGEIYAELGLFPHGPWLLYNTAPALATGFRAGHVLQGCRQASSKREGPGDRQSQCRRHHQRAQLQKFPCTDPQTLPPQSRQP